MKRTFTLITAAVVLTVASSCGTLKKTSDTDGILTDKRDNQ